MKVKKTNSQTYRQADACPNNPTAYTMCVYIPARQK